MNLDKNILDPDITATAKCHACREVVLYGREQCPYCGVKLDQEKMRIGAWENFAIDQAISSANTIRTFNPAAGLFLIASLITPFLDLAGSPIKLDFTFTIICVSAAVIVGRWFPKHGRWPSLEPEYQAAKQAVKKSFACWLAVNIVNLAILIVSKSLLVWDRLK